MRKLDPEEYADFRKTKKVLLYHISKKILVFCHFKNQWFSVIQDKKGGSIFTT
jgi:hypothetical protein